MMKLASRSLFSVVLLSASLTACASTDNGAGTSATTGSSGTPAINTQPGGTPAPAAVSGTGGVASGAAGKAATSTGIATVAGSSGAAPTAAAGTSAVAASAGSEAVTAAGTGAAGTGAAGAATAAAGSSAGAAASAEDPSALCVSGLKPRCEMRDTASCSSFVTVDVGDLVKATEIPLGPYGAVMEFNVGKGFEIPEASGEANCASVAASFGEPPETTENILNLAGSDLKLYSVYRPACMREGETYPVITWGNGTCGQTEGYGSLLRYVASYGYVVFASNSRYTGNNGAMTKALDFAEAANADEASVFYKRLDLTKVGAMGHSQGGGATVTAASDARIDSLIIWNAGVSAPKPFLAVSGDTDITGATPASMDRSIQSSSQPSAWLYYHQVPQTGSVSGHLTLMIQPERVAAATVAWWDLQLKQDAKARDYFVGPSCGLCGKDAEFEFGQKGLE